MKKNTCKLIRSFLVVMMMMIGYTWTTFAQVPVITSFSLVSAKPGNTVILMGTNFNVTLINNIVFFGAIHSVTLPNN